MDIRDIRLRKVVNISSSFMIINNCQNIKIQDIQVKGYSWTFLEIEDSQVDLIMNFHLAMGYQGMRVINSDIKEVVDCSFTLLGSERLNFGGAVYIKQSNVTFLNSTFRGNQAVTGGAIASL